MAAEWLWCKRLRLEERFDLFAHKARSLEQTLGGLRQRLITRYPALHLAPGGGPTSSRTARAEVMGGGAEKGGSGGARGGGRGGGVPP